MQAENRGYAVSKINDWVKRDRLGPVRFRPWVGSRRTEQVRGVYIGCKPIFFHFTLPFLSLIFSLLQTLSFSSYLLLPRSPTQIPARWLVGQGGGATAPEGKPSFFKKKVSTFLLLFLVLYLILPSKFPTKERAVLDLD